MTPICEFHGQTMDELRGHFEDIKESLHKQSESGEQRWAAIRGLESRKLSLSTFTFITLILIGIWGSVNTFMWNKVSRMESTILEQIKSSDKEDSEKRQRTWERINEIRDGLVDLKYKFDEHLRYHPAIKK